MLRLSVASLTCCIAMPFSANCWWETGHEVTARIAAAHLTPAAQTRVAQILSIQDTPEAVADGMAQASVWADQVKADTKTGSWHFVDIALQDHKADIAKRCLNDDCVTARIRLFAAQLSAKTTSSDSRWSDLDALRFVIHFVGDVNQPLHASSDADQGGNCETLDPPVGEAKNVHALWDGPLVTMMNTDDKALAADLNREIGAMPPGIQQQLASGTPDDWAWESHGIAMIDVYKSLKIPQEPLTFPAACSQAPTAITGRKLQIQAAYIRAMKPIVRQQLEKGGLRLAKLLNQSL